MCLEDIFGIHVSGNPVEEPLPEIFLDIRSDDEHDLSVAALVGIEDAVVQQSLAMHSYRVYLLDSTVSGAQTGCKYQQ